MPHVLAGFFSSDPDAAMAAIERLTAPEAPERQRVIQNADVPYTARYRRHPQGLWSEAFFGPPDAPDPEAWAVIELPVPMLHPLLVPAIAAELGVSEAAVRAVAGGRAWIDEDGAHVPPGHPGVDAPLDTLLFEWPPLPPPRHEETVRLQAQAVGWDTWLASWRRERGIDPDAAAKDDASWYDFAVTHTGVDALASRLGRPEHFFARRLPVAPLTQRVLEQRPGGILIADPLSKAYARVLSRARQAGRLDELDAPFIILLSAQLDLQRAIEELLAPKVARVLVHDVCDAGGCGPAPGSDPVWPIPERHAELIEVEGLAFSGAGTALVDFCTATFAIDLASGRILARWRSAGLRLAAMLGGHAIYRGSATWAFSCRELETGVWRTDSFPPELPFAFFESMEQALVIDVATGRVHPLGEVIDYPTRLLLSPCGHYLYASDKEGLGGIYRFDGELQFPIETGYYYECHRLLRADGRMTAASERESTKRDEVWSASLHALALCRDVDRWRLVRLGALFDGEDISFGFPGSISAACFDRDAHELAVVVEHSLFWIALDPTPKLRAVVDLAPLHALFVGTSPKRRLRPAALNAALFRYGTLADVRGIPESDLAALNVACTFDEPKRLGLRSARRLVSLAETITAVESLPCGEGPRSP